MTHVANLVLLFQIGVMAVCRFRESVDTAGKKMVGLADGDARGLARRSLVRDQKFWTKTIVAAQCVKQAVPDV